MGSYNITAQFAGDGNNASATSGPLNYTVSRGTQNTLTIVPPGDKTDGDAPFTLGVNGGSGSGSPHYSSNNSNVLEVDDSGNVTITGAGDAQLAPSAEIWS